MRTFLRGHDHPNFLHGASVGGKPTSEYRTWGHLWNRCTNPNNQAWKRYGGRGITVCERWRDFSVFLADMGARPSPRHQIDRVNNDGNYEPGNCRWVLSLENNRNSSNAVILEIEGVAHCIAEWADITGIDCSTISRRHRDGWRGSDLLVPPSSRGNRMIAFKHRRANKP